MNKIIGIVIALVVIVVLGAFFFTKSDPRGEGDQGPQGSIVISVTDAAVEMKNVSKVMLTISDIQMRRETGGYVTVSTKDKTYSLLELDANGKMMLYANTEIPVGTYNQIRVALDGVTLVTSDGIQKQVVLVEDNFEIESPILVKEDSQTSTVALDFLASESLHTATDGTYVFAPVVALKAQSGAQAMINKETGEVKFTNGEITAESRVGVTLSGETKIDFRLSNDVKLQILQDGTIEILNSTNGGTTIESSPLPKASDDSATKEVTSVGEDTLQTETRIEVDVTAGDSP